MIDFLSGPTLVLILLLVIGVYSIIKLKQFGKEAGLE
jgi:hypothetical protein